MGSLRCLSLGLFWVFSNRTHQSRSLMNKWGVLFWVVSFRTTVLYLYEKVEYEAYFDFYFLMFPFARK